MTHQPVSVRVYVSVFLALMALTALTVAVSRIHLGEANFVIAITIAMFKAGLVALFFMHVRGSSAITKLIIGAALFWVAILIIGTLHDYGSRGWLPGADWLP
jgi:cytochrome c oxidase subunit 4